MQRHFLDEDAAGDILILDRKSREVARFSGAAALEDAIRWASAQNLTLYSSLSPTSLFDHQNLYFRRNQPGIRRARLRNFPPSMQRIALDAEVAHPESDESDPEDVF